ncbi:SsrA-binding protein [Candidatus Saccharimonas aalborgensis]|uniref:SsrA-binding protein n=2 Tax=Candidatus Saccharimonas aalborgensis TaxID=1332188 RepID=R4PLR3_9BACT|nr:SsrA-binding protein [Candidatus Saccharimonas aalborgensis]
MKHVWNLRSGRYIVPHITDKKHYSIITTKKQYLLSCILRYFAIITSMSAKKATVSHPKAPIVNRRARFDYELDDDIVAGVSLTGPEVRAARDGHIQLRGAYVTIKDGDLWLNNASFSLKLNERGKPGAHSVDTRPRRLLASKRQIELFSARKKLGMTIVPTKMLTSGRYIKVVIALGKGKKRWDKRETIKRRQADRESSAQIKHAR